MQSVFIVIPAFNETEVIRETVKPLLGKYEVVVVDDGSDNDMFQYLKGIPIHYLRHSQNLGQGAALQTGVEYSLEQGAEYIVHFDADGQHDFREIPKFLEPLEAGEVDVCLGSRFLESKNIEAIPKARRTVLKMAIRFNNFVTGLKLTDAHNGFRAFRSEAARKVVITQNRMSHATEIISLIKEADLRFKEISTHVQYTDYSISKGQQSLNSINIVIELIISKLL